jgi:hypothetical protein
VKVVVVKDGAVCSEVAIGTGGPLVLEADIEGLDIVTDGGGDTVDAIEMSEVLTALHIDAIVVRTEIVEVLPCPKVLYVAKEKVVANLLAIGNIEIAHGETQRSITPRAISIDIRDTVAH